MRIAIFGSGGFGREVAPLALAQVSAGAADAVVFAAAEPGEHPPVNGLCQVFEDDLDGDYTAVVAVAESAQRRRIVAAIEVTGRSFVTLMADTCRLRGPSEIGDGAILCDHVVITANARIGRHFHANLYSYVAHDCVVGDFVTLAPRVCVNGNTVIEDDVYIGTGAVLKQGAPGKLLTIGRGAVIGMGAVVTKDVPAGAVVVGNPARPLER